MVIWEAHCCEEISYYPVIADSRCCSGCSSAFPDTAVSSTGGYSREFLNSVMEDIDNYFAGLEDPESLDNDKLGQIFVSACIMDDYI